MKGTNFGGCCNFNILANYMFPEAVQIDVSHFNSNSRSKACLIVPFLGMVTSAKYIMGFLKLYHCTLQKLLDVCDYKALLQHVE